MVKTAPKTPFLSTLNRGPCRLANASQLSEAGAHSLRWALVHGGLSRSCWGVGGGVNGIGGILRP